ncbi:MAG: hypothetical protein KDC95_19200 [Planctomycetes bacterium]|nr:hypothetical protein [Planctomycetota bacterium]
MTLALIAKSCTPPEADAAAALRETALSVARTVTAIRLEGPYDTLGAAAASRTFDLIDDRGVREPGQWIMNQAVAPTETQTGGPVVAARWFTIAPSPRESHGFVAVQTTAGWYSSPELAAAYTPGIMGVWEELRVCELTLATPLAGEGEPVVRLCFEHHHRDFDMGIDRVTRHVEAMTCLLAVGDSGLPSMLGPLRTWQMHQEGPMLSDPSTGDGLGSRSFDVFLRLTLVHDSLLEIRGLRKDPNGRNRRVLETWAIEFP